MPGGRQFVHQVKLTGEQEARLRTLAEAAGVSPVRLLVESALSEGRETPSARRVVYAELLRLRRDVHGLGTNLNQLATWANTEGRWAQEAALQAVPIERAVEAIEATMRRLRS